MMSNFSVFQRIRFNGMDARKKKVQNTCNRCSGLKWMSGIRQWMMRVHTKKTTTIIKNSGNFWRREAEKVFPIPLTVCVYGSNTFFFHFIKVFNRNRHQLRAMPLNGALCIPKTPDNWAVHIDDGKKGQTDSGDRSESK